MKRKVFAVLVVASRIVVVDADSESEAQKLAMSDAEFEPFHIDEASTEQANLSDDDIDQQLRHGAQDMREKS